MPLWKLVPTARPTDPRWLDRPIYQEVVVRAATSGAARQVAARFELGMDARKRGLHSVGNSSEPLGSALEDEKLYRMLAVEPKDEPSAEAGMEEDAVLKAVRVTDTATRH